MSFSLAFHLFAIGVNIALGVLVFRTNPRRVTNQIFLFLSALLVCWLLLLGLAFLANQPADAIRLIRGCLCAAVFFPLAFEYMRVSIVNPADTKGVILRRHPVWLGVTVVMAGLALSPFLVTGVRWPDANSARNAIPEPIYGPLFFVFVLCFVLLLGLLVWRFAKSLPHCERIQREELLFILLGAGTSIFVVVILAMVVPLFTGSSQTVKFTPMAVIVLYAFIAYGIATRRIMGVAYFVRVGTAYVLLALYLACLYVGTWWLVVWMAKALGPGFSMLPYVVASLVVAFSLAPAQGWMQRFANRLFVSTACLDIATVIQSANRILRSISTVDTLLADFADTVGRAVGTDRVMILVAEKDRYVQRFPHTPAGRQESFTADESLLSVLRQTNEPLVPELMRRVRATPLVAEACRAVEQMQMAAAVGMRSPEGMEGVVVFGPRLSGRIYGAPEQQTLQLLCNQLAVALNNARLYTQVQDGKIYNDILVDSLASGVIAAGTDGVITVFNREARRLTHLEAADIRGRSLRDLPSPLAAVLATALQEMVGQRDRELALGQEGDEGTPVRVSSAVFYGHTGRILGAFLVMNDLTAVKRLESQVRRSDRLASLGTLAAGMAHEIKNPLVSIKTFTQLLPERYDDLDFRETFFSLVGNEVKRIDQIVNQLLRFSRPSRPNLAPTALHGILTNTLNLMTQQMRQSNVRLVRNFESPSDHILADGDQLNQAFINFALNALESMTAGGTLTVATGTADPTRVPPGARAGNGNWLQITITDTGEGITQEHLARIFDPFFTTKSQGTGLGLSVAHRIVTEHGGLVDVTSEVGRGTSFYLILPLIPPEAAS
jgi:signal transduction histidine kinase